MKRRKLNNMKKIGLKGGTGSVSSQEYYKIINETVNKNQRGLTFPEIISYSVNYSNVYACNQQNDREGVYSIVKKTAIRFVIPVPILLHFVPEKPEREFIHDSIMNELLKDIFLPETTKPTFSQS